MTTASSTFSDTAGAGQTVLVAIHAAHAQFVWRTLQRLGVRTCDLEDVHQQVFMVVHRRLATFDTSRESMRPWLFGICLRVSSAHRRRAYHRHESHSGELPEVSSSCEQNPERLLEQQEARRQLNEILGGMDLQKRAVFVMFEIERLGCAEIADSLGVPVGTVYSRLSSAREEFEKAVRRLHARTPQGAAR